MNYIIDRIKDHEHYYDLFTEILPHVYKNNFELSWRLCNSKTVNYNRCNGLINLLCNNIIYSSNLKDLICSFYDKDKVKFKGKAWLNRYDKGEFQEPHIHISDVSDKEIAHPDLSFVYFVDIPEGSHCFNFCNKYGNNKKYINETSGDLLIFNSDLPHSVDVNTSDKYRYTIAGNIYLK